ncbi:MAG: sterol desaturase family protein [Pseudomonadota bacterium]|nr:sterol desaturase family protein [Pseudomonadota bacterium]
MQILLFTTAITFLWLVEKFILAEHAGDKWRHTSTNILLIFSALPLQFVAGLLLMALSSRVTSHHWGLVYFLPDASSPWIKYFLMFFLLDFLDYVYHRAMHTIPGFWKFHLVHHTDRKLDVSTTLREHPGETILRNCFLMIWVLLCGASFGVLILRQTGQTLFNIFSHTSMRLPPLPARLLGWLLITPNLHHVHHHFKMPYTDRNYGDIFSIWDRILGTFAELSAKDTVFGLDTHMDEAMNGHYFGIVTMPFRTFRYAPAVRRRAMRLQWLTLLAILGILSTAAPVQARGQDFSYKVMHPVYGDIGTLTESIARGPGSTHIGIRVHIAVKILGITVYREEGDRTEIFHGNRFVSLRSSTVTNGTRLDVRGDARGNHFVVTSPSGVADAPVNVFPSDPWMVRNHGVGTSVAIETGEVLATRITGGEPALISLQGVTVATRHFVASSKDQRYDVWINDRDVPVMFRSLEDGTPIDFILTSPVREAANTDDHLAPAAKLDGKDYVAREKRRLSQ